MNDRAPDLDRPGAPRRTLTGFGGTFPASCTVARPEKERDVRRRLLDSGTGGAISRGAGSAYGDAAVNEDGTVLLHERLDRMLGFDEKTGALDAEGGVLLGDILETFVPRGWFLPVTPGTRRVTLGGAIAADVHGKNHHREGSIASFVDSITLVTGAGERMECSHESHADVFWATLGGMGLTGAILSARLRLRPIETSYMSVDYERAKDIDVALGKFLDGDGRYEHSVAWIDCLASGGSLGRSVLMRANHTLREELSGDLRRDPLRACPGARIGVPFAFPSFALNPLTVRMFNGAYYARHSNSRALAPYGPFFYPLDGVSNWRRMYGKRGFVQHQCVLPPESSRKGLVELLQALSKSGRPSFLAVLKSLGRGSRGPLSFPFEGHTLALDLPYTGPDLERFVRELDEIVLKHSGRVYLAKDALLAPETFRAMYPRYGEFRAIKERLDPEGRITSSMARRLELVERR